MAGWLKKNEAKTEVEAEPAIRLTEAEPVETSKGNPLEDLATVLIQERTDAIREKREAKERKENEKRRLREALAAADVQKEAAMRSCTHKKPDGNWATGGQPNNDGMVTLLCLRCPREWRIKPSPANLEAIRRGDLSLSGIEPPRDDVPVTAEALVA